MCAVIERDADVGTDVRNWVALDLLAVAQLEDAEVFRRLGAIDRRDRQRPEPAGIILDQNSIATRVDACIQLVVGAVDDRKNFRHGGCRRDVDRHRQAVGFENFKVVSGH